MRANCRKSGIVTQHAYNYFGEHVKDIMPALGTHAPMTPDEISKVERYIFPSIPPLRLLLYQSHNVSRCLAMYHTIYFESMIGGKVYTKIPFSFILRIFFFHRNDVVTIGEVPKELVFEASDGQVNEPWPAQLNKLVRYSNAINLTCCNTLFHTVSPSIVVAIDLGRKT
jgi:hypothetical protein